MDSAATRNHSSKPTPATTANEETNSRYRLDGEYAAVPNTEDKRDAMQIAEESKGPP